ncbi:MAG: DUF3363 domain-containing protein [Rhodospirillales bacterium]
MPSPSSAPPGRVSPPSPRRADRRLRPPVRVLGKAGRGSSGALQQQLGAIRPGSNIVRYRWRQRARCLRRFIILTSGRFAMLDDGVGFSLVPWKPVLEQRLG